jgi:hypothetical protein
MPFGLDLELDWRLYLDSRLELDLRLEIDLKLDKELDLESTQCSEPAASFEYALFSRWI